MSDEEKQEQKPSTETSEAAEKAPEEKAVESQPEAAEAKPEAVEAKGEAAEAKPEGEEKAERPSAPSAQDLLKEELGDLKIRRAKGSKNITAGVVNILATFNNTRVTISDTKGNVISWSSAGKCGFRGSRKSTAFAAQVVTQDAGRAAMGHGLKEVDVRVKGPGMGRDSAVRALQSLGLNVLSITDITPVPHNGCRPPKRRRV